MENTQQILDTMIQANFDYTKPLYHGTNMDFNSKRLKVFSSEDDKYANELWDSFYLTNDEEQAKNYAQERFNDTNQKGLILVKKFKLDISKFTEKLKFDVYNSLDDRTARFIASNVLKERLEECQFLDNSCYKCNERCPRNSEFVYGILIDSVIDEVLKGIHQGLSNEEISNLIYEAVGFIKNPIYQLAVRESALHFLIPIETVFYEQDQDTGELKVVSRRSEVG